jgi:hypothetical protein
MGKGDALSGCPRSSLTLPELELPITFGSSRLGHGQFYPYWAVRTRRLYEDVEVVSIRRHPPFDIPIGMIL